ncbi:MAG: helix-turn-helix transcriptional regulator, partial [Erysipelotrichia bacterium]|nr:helix-turn-helix transcriptional regulator [Erysipelotrichia bacterium]
MGVNLNIAGNLERLRKQREITQEDLANFIGISFQAVSKWERGDGYPDITILPVLANFFDVSLDELVGMNEIKNQAKFEEIKAQCNKLTSEGKIKESITLLRKTLKVFPNNYWLLAELACFLDGHGETDEEKQKNWEESIKISERIIEFCPDPVIRSNVQSNMCFSLFRKGDKRKAIELAEKLPNIYKTREFTLNRFLERDRQIEECQIAIQKLTWGLWWQLSLLAARYKSSPFDEGEHYTAEQSIKIYQKAIEVYKLVYEEEDYYFSHCRLEQSYEGIAKAYFKLGNNNKIIANLEKAAEHAIA